jgi:uncharacterized membrane protein
MGSNKKLYLPLPTATHMNDQTYLILFRLLHIACGVFWAGSVFYFTFFIIPAVKKPGPGGTTFLQQPGGTGFPKIIVLTAAITILSGVMLLWKLSNHFERIWFTTLYAKILSAGMVTSTIAFLVDVAVRRPASNRINRISAAIDKSGGAPTTEQLNELAALRKKIFTATKIIAVLLIITIISMSIFRYVS